MSPAGEGAGEGDNLPFGVGPQEYEGLFGPSRIARVQPLEQVLSPGRLSLALAQFSTSRLAVPLIGSPRSEGPFAAPA